MSFRQTALENRLVDGITRMLVRRATADNIKTMSVISRVLIAVVLSTVLSAGPVTLAYYKSTSIDTIAFVTIATVVAPFILSFLMGITSMQACADLVVEHGRIAGADYAAPIEVGGNPSFEYGLVQWFHRQFLWGVDEGVIGAVVALFFLVVLSTTK